MRVDLRLEMRGGDKVELGRLSTEYGSFEALKHRVRMEGCSIPHAVEDLVLWKALEDPDTVVETYLTYQGPAIFADLTPRRLELLQRLVSKTYPSIRKLAGAAERDYKNVYDDLMALQRWGLVELVRQGRNLRPTSRVAEVRLVLD